MATAPTATPTHDRVGARPALCQRPRITVREAVLYVLSVLDLHTLADVRDAHSIVVEEARSARSGMYSIQGLWRAAQLTLQITAVAAGHGMKGVPVIHASELRGVLEGALQPSRPVLVEIDVT